MAGFEPGYRSLQEPEKGIHIKQLDVILGERRDIWRAGGVG